MINISGIITRQFTVFKIRLNDERMILKRAARISFPFILKIWQILTICQALAIDSCIFIRQIKCIERVHMLKGG